MTGRDQEEGRVGYKRPPRATRFRKGTSGNPQGRPRNRRRELPYDTVLGQMVTIREDGRERRVTAAEAFLLQLTRKGSRATPPRRAQRLPPSRPLAWRARVPTVCRTS